MTDRTDNAGRRHIALTTAVLLTTGVALAYAGGGAGRIAAQPPVPAIETERPVESEPAAPVSAVATDTVGAERPTASPSPAIEREQPPAEPRDTEGAETSDEPAHETVPPSIRDEDGQSDDDTDDEPDEERSRSNDEERRGPLGNKPSERPQPTAQ